MKTSYAVYLTTPKTKTKNLALFELYTYDSLPQAVGGYK